MYLVQAELLRTEGPSKIYDAPAVAPQQMELEPPRHATCNRLPQGR